MDLAQVIGLCAGVGLLIMTVAIAIYQDKEKQDRERLKESTDAEV